MTPVRFGIVSTAKIAREWVIPAMTVVPECEVVAITSRDKSRAARVATEFGIPRYYGSLEEMLNDTQVEAVYIASPNNLHVQETMAAARAGRHVLCEKPIALTAAEAIPLIDVQRETGLQISEAFMVRYHPRWLAAREIVRAGKLGSVSQIHATYSVLNDNPNDIRFKPELGGGALADVGVYPITAARFLFEEEPVAATATFQNIEPGGVDIAVSGMLEFPKSRALLFTGALMQAWAHWIVAIGTEGWMEIPIAVWPSANTETALRLHGRLDLNDAAIETLTFHPANQYECEVRDFALAVRGLIAQPWPIANAVAGMRALDAVRKSALTGSRVLLEMQ